MSDNKINIPADVVERLSQTIQESQYFRMVAYAYAGATKEKRKEIDEMMYRIYLRT